MMALSKVAAEIKSGSGGGAMNTSDGEAAVASAYHDATTATTTAATGLTKTKFDVEDFMDALRENEVLANQIDDFGKVLDRAERDYNEETKAIADNKLSFVDYLRNTYIMYARWIIEETSASPEIARKIYFCVARHINTAPTTTPTAANADEPALAMGVDLELLYHVSKWADSSAGRGYIGNGGSGGGGGTAAAAQALAEHLGDDVGRGTRFDRADIESAVKKYATQGALAFPMELSLREFTVRLQHIDVAVLDAHSMCSGLRGPLTYTSGPVPFDLSRVDSGDAQFWPRGHSLGLQMLRSGRYVRRTRSDGSVDVVPPLRPGDRGYQSRPLKSVGR